MNKKMFYRKSVVCFLMVGIIMVLYGLRVLTGAKGLFYVVMVAAGIVVLYALVSTTIYVRNEIKGKN